MANLKSLNMKDTIINLTPPIDGVQYGYLETELDGTKPVVNISTDRFSSMAVLRNPVFSTNPKDQRFPFLQLPSKEQEVERLNLKLGLLHHYLQDTKDYEGVRLIQEIIAGFNANKGIYTQEQMELAFKAGADLYSRIKHDMDTKGFDFKDFLQSLQPTAKAVRVEREVDLHSLKSSVTSKSTISISAFSNIKVETSSEYPQGIMVAKEVIY